MNKGTSVTPCNDVSHYECGGRPIVLSINQPNSNQFIGNWPNSTLLPQEMFKPILDFVPFVSS